MDADSPTTAPDERANAATMAGAFTVPQMRVRLGSPIPEKEPKAEGPPQVPRFSGRISRVIRAATAKHEGFAITVNDDTIGVIEGALIWSAAHRYGVSALLRYNILTG